jgi:hypothetical protein
MKTTFSICLAALTLVGLSACSSSPTPSTTTTAEAPAQPAGPPQPVDAKTAYYDMYDQAHMWASDITGLSLESGEVQGVKNADGKAGLWTAIFGSPSQHQARTYVYSVADALPTITKGVKAQEPIMWAGPTQKAMAFDNGDFKINSDAAYTTAAMKAGDWLQKNADKPLTMTLGAASQFPNPIWKFLWGDEKSGYVVLVNATTGAVVTK